MPKKMKRAAVPVITLDFDDDAEYLSMLVCNVIKTGTLDVDLSQVGDRAVNAYGPLVKQQKNYKSWFPPDVRQTRLAKSSRLGKFERKLSQKLADASNWADPAGDNFTRDFYVANWFPHVTPFIAAETCANWEDVGDSDSAKRGISKLDWLWKRSRFLAGFR